MEARPYDAVRDHLLSKPARSDERYHALKEMLEGMVDTGDGLKDVYTALHAILLDKAKHLRAAWQDEPLAKEYELAARRLARINRD